jgi:hypothetical protein
MAQQLKVPAYLMQDAPTRLVGQVLSMAPGAVFRLPGGPIGRHRKYIRITNEDTNTPLFLVAGDEQSIDATTTTVKLAKLGQNDFIELYTNAPLYLKNIAGAETVNPVAILEIYYE